MSLVRATTGREGEQERFTSLTALLFDRQSQTGPRILNVSGASGVGKSWMVAVFRELAAGSGALVADVDAAQTDELASMLSWVHQLKAEGASMSSFLGPYEKYLKEKVRLKHLDANDEFAEHLVEFGAGLLSIPASMVPFAGPVLAAGVSTLGTPFGRFVARHVRDARVRQFILNPVETFTPIFVQALQGVSTNHPPLLMIDRYERALPRLDDWLLRFVLGRYGSIQKSMALVVAGQESLNALKWSVLETRIVQMPLRPFTLDETRDYLLQRGVSDDAVITEMFELSAGLPALLALMRPGGAPLAAGTGVPGATRALVGWFLRSVSDSELRDIALNISLARWFNRDVFNAIAGIDQDANVFEQILDMPIVRPAGNAWAYHEQVRPHMVRYLRQLSPQQWSRGHEALAGFHSNSNHSVATVPRRRPELAGMTPDARRHATEVIYHRLCANPDRERLPVLTEILTFLPQTDPLGSAWARGAAAILCREWAAAVTEAGIDCGHPGLRDLGRLLATLISAGGQEPAIASLTLREYEDAVFEVEEALRPIPGSSVVRVLLARVFEANQSPERAASIYTSIQASDGPSLKLEASVALTRLLASQTASSTKEVAEKLAAQGGLAALDVAILSAGTAPQAVATVKEVMGDTYVYALGSPAGDTSIPGQGTDSDLLHFTIDDAQGVERVMLPVFTQPAIMREALLRNPDWQTLSVLEMEGAALLENIDDDVIVVINPWSSLEFQIPSREMTRPE